ncbi:DNA repair protein RecO [Evansella halocellulosilytica]|uniref:DNA repair protein RecO n=1 Tax=Evansella halocellulosilytica TaxID=2011013 RepID=UPI000BB8C96E|nr:DNA repair protein RecO [Evansella halocellulosilytica]
MLHKVEGIIIRTNDYGETNKIITVLTRENGKVALMARGAKRPKSRFASSAQLFMYGMFIYQRSSGIGTLNQADIIDSFKEVRKDLKLTSHAAYIVEMVDRLTEDHKRDPYLFELVYQLHVYLNEGVDPDILTRIFETKMLDVAGVRPNFSYCVLCGQTDDAFVFSIRQGGILCNRCKHEDAYHMKVNQAVIKLLRLFQQFDLKRLGNISVKKETKAQLKEVLQMYFDEYVGIRLKSKRFLDQIDSMFEEGS